MELTSVHGMARFKIIVLALCQTFLALRGNASPGSVQADVYGRSYFKANDAIRLERDGRFLDSRVEFDECLYYLHELRRHFPDWQRATIDSRTKDYEDEIVTIEAQAAQEALTPEGRASPARLFSEGVRLETTHQEVDALPKFEKCLMILQLLQTHDPGWKSAFVQQKITAAQAKTTEIRERLLPKGFR